MGSKWVCAAALLLLMACTAAALGETLDLSALGNIEEAAQIAEAPSASWTYALPRELLEDNEYIVLANRDHLLSEDYIPPDLV